MLIFVAYLGTQISSRCYFRGLPRPAVRRSELGIANLNCDLLVATYRYNFDFVRGVPLDAGGRFEWTPVVSI